MLPSVSPHLFWLLNVLMIQEVDAIYIGTPHNFHYENANGALKGGKAVLCEKPFTIDLAELDDLMALAKKQNKLLME
jgi:dihydrodiol dehydrogenase / D-xylose 1-dehydrogenase (NADP)